MAEDKDKKKDESEIVKEAQKLGGIVVKVRNCYKQYECENCKVERCENK